MKREDRLRPAAHPLGWTQPVLPPLPEGEAQRTWPVELWGAPAKHPPQSAPGFQAAWRLGLLPPPVGPTPPQVLPGRSAGERLALAVAAFFGCLLVVLVLPGGLPGWAQGLLTAVAFAVSLWIMATQQTRADAEHAAGYTTLPGHTGTWRLRRNGTVHTPPAPGVPPPGFYPSPYFPGLLQRWNGPAWAPLPQDWWHHPERCFRWPERPYLDGVPPISDR